MRAADSGQTVLGQLGDMISNIASSTAATGAAAAGTCYDLPPSSEACETNAVSTSRARTWRATGQGRPAVYAPILPIAYMYCTGGDIL